MAVTATSELVNQAITLQYQRQQAVSYCLDLAKHAGNKGAVRRHSEAMAETKYLIVKLKARA